jgi:hypothetical protein
VRATIQRASTNVRSAVKQTVIVTGKQATYLADANRLNVSGGVKVVNDDPGARRSMTMTGKTASVVLSRPSGAGARSAVQSSSVQGPVLFELDTTEVDSDGITHVAHIEGSADNVDYAAGSSRDARQERTVHLTGSVHIIRTESAKKADGSEVEGSKRTQVFEGSSATLNIGAVPDLPGQETVTSATVDGPVTFTMDGSRLETSKKTDKKTHTTTTETAWTPYHIESKSDSLTYTAFDTADERGATSELTLLGHVSVKGTILGASLRGIDRAELWLDPQGDVVKANLHGAHGVVKVKPPQVGLASRPSSLIPVKPGYAT